MPVEAPPSPLHLWAPLAWLPGGWREHVVARADADGRWAEVTAGVATPPPDAHVVDAPLLPGVVDAHSHAFQRAFVAGAETRDGEHDDFWSWRERMYDVARRISPGQLRAVAAHLYLELLRGGYTHVCEFHYLRRDVRGRDYADPLAMSWALAQAAADVGIGLTILPVLYERASFATPLRDEQRRFRADAQETFAAAARIRAAARPLVDAGVAIHSLRAVDAGPLAEVAAHARKISLPVHIHVAEQMQEVEDCLAHTGLRPIEWLMRHASMDARWNLVHATHTNVTELQGVRAAGASIVICPTTEANLGDGVFDLPGYASIGGHWSIGSDSHVARHWAEELRLLEYSQRLQLRQRNVAARGAGRESTAAALFEGALNGGRAATGQRIGAIQAGHRADFMIVDEQSPALLGVPSDHLLDAMIFASPEPRLSDVFVAGQAVVTQGQVVGRDSMASLWPQLAENYRGAMNALWAA